MSQGAMIAGAFILVVVCCSSSLAMLMMGGDEKKTTTPTTSTTSTTSTTPAPTDTCVGGSVCPSKLTSPSGACVAVMQDDGNYVVYDSAGTAIWDSKTMGRGTGPYRITMQSDGNFVLYDSADTASALWHPDTISAPATTPINLPYGNYGVYKLSAENEDRILLQLGEVYGQTGLEIISYCP